MKKIKSFSILSTLCAFGATIGVNQSLQTHQTHNVYSKNKLQSKQSAKWNGPDSFLFAKNNTYIGTANGLFVSKDGINFSQVTSIPKSGQNGKISIIKEFNNKIYVGTRSGMYVSKDGSNFQLIPSFNTNNIYNLMMAKNGDIYVVSFNGIYVSKDGLSFKKINALPGGCVPTIIYQTSNGDIYVGTNLGLFISQDGNKFTLNKNVAQYAVYAIKQMKNGDVYVGGADGAYIKRNRAPFTIIKKLGGSSIFGFDQNINGDIYIATAIDGLYRTTDGINFNKLVLPHTTQFTIIYQITHDSKGDIYLGTTTGLMVSKNGVDFKIIQSIPTTSIFELNITKNNKFYAFAKTVVYYSTDGNTFKTI